MVSVSVHDTFPIIISGRQEPIHRVGAEITVKILTLEYTEEGMPQMVGELSRRTRRQIMVEERERNIQTLLNTIDDELTGLEVQDIPGKGRGVKVRTERLRIRTHFILPGRQRLQERRASAGIHWGAGKAWQDWEEICSHTAGGERLQLLLLQWRLSVLVRSALSHSTLTFLLFTASTPVRRLGGLEGWSTTASWPPTLRPRL